MRLLLIEDDEALREAMLEALRAEGHAVDAFGRGAHGLAALQDACYDALVLDLGLPDMDGLMLLRRLRERGDGLPVLLLTARADWQDRVRGLDEGADDYLGKPFVLPELLARLRALARRHSLAHAATLQLGALSLDIAQRQASAAGLPLALTPREWAVLLELASSSPRVVPKRRLTQSLSEWDHEVSANAIETQVSRLRQKLDGLGLQLDTVRGVGYRLLQAGP
ncbi:response regulator transcription factor [Paucibacter sp. APW11]|uniref:Response regulator transcription factor n=1 Tax=Roseateles aquae TaxID=3077235 RepID=A0ABU3PHV0_9BURK|nr:response regulator transcription factor [Paucibacter sp. APW11]MDT9002000.1 response regulator transcription factor [Paucibacter sp. APW11]